MILGVLADTHSFEIPSAVIERFKTVDLIIHAGDIDDMPTLKMIKALKPLKAVCGNTEAPALKRLLPLKEVVVCDDVRIGVTHGHVGRGPDALTNAVAAFKDQKLDAVIFGHSHQPLKEKIGSTLYFNPGSCNDTVRAPFLSYGIISCTKGKLEAEIIKI